LLRGYRSIPFASISGIPLVCQLLSSSTFNNEFDCRGACESGGTTRHGGLANDVEDVRVVVAYLTQEYGYKIDLLVGHSRGSVVAIRWLCTSDEGKNVGGFVNMAGRYKMDVRAIRPSYKRVLVSDPLLASREYYRVSGSFN
jgi:alpha-beta hydrolase superfamily lysophospholipase